MKYNELLEALKAKFTGVSDTILARVAKKLEQGVNSDDDVKNAVEAVTFQQVLESYGDSRATDAQKTAVLNYEKKYGIKEGKPLETNDGTNKETDPKPNQEPNAGDVPAWAQALIEANKSLSQQVQAMAGQKVSEDRRQKLNGVIGKLPESLRKGYERITLDSMEDEAFENLLQEVTTEVEGIQREQSARGAVFGKPTAPAGTSQTTPPQGKASDDEVKAVLKHIPLK